MISPCSPVMLLNPPRIILRTDTSILIHVSGIIKSIIDLLWCVCVRVCVCVCVCVCVRACVRAHAHTRAYSLQLLFNL